MERAEEKTSQGRLKNCDGCGVTLQEREVYSFKEKVFCQGCYLGDKERGPLGDQVIPCPHCGEPLNKYTVVCFHCNNPIRQVGKVEAETKGLGIRILGFIVAFFVVVLVAVALGPVSTAAGGSQGRAALLGIFGPLFAMGGLFRILFGMVFKKVPILNTAIGTFLGGVLLLVGVLLVLLLPFP